MTGIRMRYATKADLLKKLKEIEDKVKKDKLAIVNLPKPPIVPEHDIEYAPFEEDPDYW